MLGPNEPFHRGFTAWAERVAERTNGGLEIQVLNSAQLGVEEDIIEQIRQGANIGQNTDAARLGNYVPGIAVVNGPYFVSAAEQAFALADAPTMQGWLDTLASDHGIRVVCFDWVQGFRNFFTNEEIRTPADLEGLRIRTPPAPIWQESIRALGAEPTAMAFGDVYPGLQQRAIVAATIGNFTPPVGAAMYAVCTIMKTSIGAYTRESLGLLAAVAAVAVALVFLPEVVLFLPNLLFDR